MDKKIIILSIIVLGLVGVAYLVTTSNKNGNPSYTWDPIEDNSAPQKSKPAEKSYVFKPLDPDNPKGITDGKLIQINNITGQETILIESVKKAWTNFKRGAMLVEIAQSDQYPYVYFTEGNTGGSRGIIRFDTGTESFTELSMGKFFDSSGSVVAPNDDKAITVVEEDLSRAELSNLYQINFDEDKIIKIATLPKSQTFNICDVEGCNGSYGFTAEWMGSDEYILPIYDSTKVLDENGWPEPAKILEKRKFKLQ